VTRLYDATSSLVYGLALRLVRDPEQAEEVTMDVYLEAWERAASFRPERASVEVWLAMIARSRAIDRVRAETTRREGEACGDLDVDRVADGGREPFASRVRAEEAERVAHALERLPREQRDALELVYHQGLSHRRAAASLGEPVGTIKTRVRLGLDRLRTALRTREEA